MKYDANGNIINPWTSSKKQALDLLHRFGTIQSTVNFANLFQQTFNGSKKHGQDL